MAFMEDVSDVVLIDFASTIIDRLKLSVDTNSALSNLSNWLCDYTKLDADTPWSFKDHEMQIDIVNDTCARQVVQKCSQVGLTNTSKRKALGITVISKGKNVMYVGPTSKWVTKFAKTELHPTIDTSPILRGALNKNAKGTEVIGLGSSFLHLGGTTGAVTGAISVPASYIFIDEVDFCNQTVLGKYESRMKHAKMDEYGRKGMMAYFSTPTFEDFGINLMFKHSDQKYYDVKCSGCEHWITPDYFRDVVLPGFTDRVMNKETGECGKMIDLTAEEVKAEIYDVQNAYMRCPVCLERGRDHDLYDDLCDPKRRMWRAKNPTSKTSGRQVFPWDLPKVNTIPSIIMGMTGYATKADFINFGLGLPYSDSENSFLMSPFSCGTYSRWMERKLDTDIGAYCIGVDVGKTSNIMVGKKTVTGQLEVVYLERFRSSSDKTLGERVVEIAKDFKSRVIVIDAAPDFTTAQYVARKLPSRTVLACEYSKSKPKKKMSNLDINEEEGVVAAYRTGVIKEVMKMHNKGQVIWPNQNQSKDIEREVKEVMLNLKNLKKLAKKDDEGEMVERYVKTGPDHYGHALTYLNMACNVFRLELGTATTPAPIGVTTFKTQGKETARVIGAIGG